MVYYNLKTVLRILITFLQNCLGFQIFSSLITYLTYYWSLLQCTMILAEIEHVQLDSSIQHRSLSNCIFIIISLPYIEIKLHTSIFIS